MQPAGSCYRLGIVLLSLLSAAAIGWIAFQLQQQKVLPGFMYPLLFPLLAGAVAGAACGGLLTRLPLGTVAVVLMAASVGLIAVAVEVLCGYQYYVATIERQLRSDAIAVLAQNTHDAFSPASLPRYVAVRVRNSGGWWIADLLLTVFASIAACWLIRATVSKSPRTGSSPISQAG